MKPTPLRVGAKSLARGSTFAAERKPLKRTASKPRRQAISPASPAQKAKAAAGTHCVGCGKPRTAYRTLDPAHLAARGGPGLGCDDADCVVLLCRTMDAGCHRIFDAGDLDLLPKLEPHYRPELAHAVTHLGLVGTLRRVTGDRGVAA